MDLRHEVPGLLGQHPRIADGRMWLQIDDLGQRAARHFRSFVPEFGRYQALRQQLLQDWRSRVRVDEFKARPLSSLCATGSSTRSTCP